MKLPLVDFVKLTVNVAVYVPNSKVGIGFIARNSKGLF